MGHPKGIGLAWAGGWCHNDSGNWLGGLTFNVGLTTLILAVLLCTAYVGLDNSSLKLIWEQ